MKLLRLFTFLAVLATAEHGWAQALPVFDKAGPDAVGYGMEDGYPIGSVGTMRAQKFVVGTYSHLDEVLPSNTIAPSETPSELRRAPHELALQYEYQGKQYSLTDYLARNPATGVLILHGREIEFEHYQYGRRNTDRLTSQSMAKTIVALLVGIAIQNHKIHSLDDIVAIYVPELANTEAGKTPLRALMHMASGLNFHEVYDGKDDIRRLGHDLMATEGKGAAEVVRQFNNRIAKPDTEFHYSGLDSELLGLVVSRATGQTLAELTQTQLWQPIGAEAEATWITDHQGLEIAYCCVNATLRDWGRLGALLANDGNLAGQQVVPKQFILDATTVQAPFLAPGFGGRRLGYGYQTWLMPGPRRQFALVGIYGQTILVDPASRTVLVQTAVRPKARDPDAQTELFALWNALLASEKR